MNRSKLIKWDPKIKEKVISYSLSAKTKITLSRNGAKTF